MKRELLIIAHQPSENTTAMARAALQGASHPDFDNVQARLLRPEQTAADNILAASAVLLGTTENFGYMAGLMKDFLERIYYPCLEKTEAMPYSLYIRAGNDGSGAKTSIERIITGLKWKPVQEPLICVGDFREDFLAQVEEQAMTLAAGLDTGIY